MKIISFQTTSGPVRTGALLADGASVLDFDAPGAGLPARQDAFTWFDLDGEAHQAARALVSAVEADAAKHSAMAEAGAILAADEVCTLAPVPRPGKFFCIGLNYRDHAEESGMDIPTRPLIFSKFSSCVVGPGAQVELPPGAKEVDYEAEFGVVIGRRTRKVSKEQALDSVLGYTNINDVSARDFQFADGQWQRGKACDTFAPMGPYILTADLVPNPEQLRIQFRLNGKTLQDSTTAQLIFNVAEIVADLSQFFTLEPGDVIATGTPPGVGFARKPPIYIKDGDTMEVEVEGLGVLANPVVGPQ
ncbi:MAG: 2-keto-4-pentenoate hydratase/2-oxohepta-3-ene-1,7-dioic acid hydratase in catechol pathway [Planctomycetota bacterium]|jgi:2-keto-4-pentenoate hydratase/2-oxohepta-3-ene-1,7-dioic acid hydratase in catechol pathway